MQINFFEQFESSKLELEKSYDHLADVLILRSKAEWYERGEKRSKYFLTLEKSRKAKMHLRKVLREE